MKVFLIIAMMLLCSSCVIQKDVNIVVDRESTAEINVYITGSEVRDNKADGKLGLAPL